MTTLVLMFLAGVVVVWVARHAGSSDARDETERFARVRAMSTGWAEESRRAYDRSETDDIG